MLQRYSTTISEISANTATTTSESFRYGTYAGGMLFIPSGSSITTITWYAAETDTGTWLAVKDEDGTAVTQTVAASEAHQLPTALYGARYLMPVVNAAGTILFTLKG